MRTDAEIDESLAVLDRVAGDFRLPFGLLVDQLNLERLAAATEKSAGFLARPHLPLVWQILLGHLSHLLLDSLEIFGNERTWHDEVVEKPFIDRRPNAALHARKQVRDRRSQQVGCAVAIDGQPFRTVRGDQPDLRVLVQAERQIHETVVYSSRECGLGQTRRNCGGQVPNGRARRD